MLFDLRCLYSCFSGNSQPLPVGIRVSHVFFLDGSDIFFLFSISSCFTCVYILIKSIIMRIDYKFSKFQVNFQHISIQLPKHSCYIYPCNVNTIWEHYTF